MNTDSLENSTNAQKDEISLGELFLKLRKWINYLFSKWVLIMTFGIVGGILGLTYAYFKKPLYTASTTFVLEEEKSGGMGSLSSLASLAGVDLGGGGGIFQGDNILELYKSRNMIQKTLLTKIIFQGKEESLIEHYISFNKMKDKWTKKKELLNINFNSNKWGNFTRLQDSVLGVVVKDVNKYNLQVTKPDKKLSIIKVDVRCKDEFFAKSFNNEIVKNVNEFYVQTKTKKYIDNINILQQKTDSVRAVMNGNIFSAAAIADATPNLNPTRQVQRIAPVQRSQFSAETNKALLGELVKNLEMSKIAYRKEAPLIQIVDEPILPLEVEDNVMFLYSIIFSVISMIFTGIYVILKKGL
ncbi:lipopolysaccharide biosynthesis protein [Arcticibacter svalbardensis MN12-7]|uniref:Lipopolysaccharide biosynthesis protein n=1 Tax=Arcticibacter svalbardensis MN12-7 TaxID=1150600 RepID=R9GQL3_9SPHI|nr:Wzz/FepE/Etk N-terminal domain-containing protein [Arcticibacter svalbardensis]EOR94008.1 lipopolysaccharide biosynthesis protein [Arcticibacter svalbardensis MN12-7]